MKIKNNNLIYLLCTNTYLFLLLQPVNEKKSHPKIILHCSNFELEPLKSLITIILVTPALWVDLPKNFVRTNWMRLKLDMNIREKSYPHCGADLYNHVAFWRYLSVHWTSSHKQYEGDNHQNGWNTKCKWVAVITKTIHISFNLRNNSNKINSVRNKRRVLLTICAF